MMVGRALPEHNVIHTVSLDSTWRGSVKGFIWTANRYPPYAVDGWIRRPQWRCSRKPIIIILKIIWFWPEDVQLKHEQMFPMGGNNVKFPKSNSMNSENHGRAVLLMDTHSLANDIPAELELCPINRSGAQSESTGMNWSSFRCEYDWALHLLILVVFLANYINICRCLCVRFNRRCHIMIRGKRRGRLNWHLEELSPQRDGKRERSMMMLMMMLSTSFDFVNKNLYILYIIYNWRCNESRLSFAKKWRISPIIAWHTFDTTIRNRWLGKALHFLQL